MHLYKVTIPRSEYETEGHDEQWFSGKAEAVRFARDFARDASDNDWQTDEVPVERVEIKGLPRKALALALLNQRGYVVETQPVTTFRIKRSEAPACD